MNVRVKGLLIMLVFAAAVFTVCPLIKPTSLGLILNNIQIV